MATTTAIQWTDHTFNPWIGCTKVHAGCANCYAEADMDTRRGRVKWGRLGTRSKTSAANWRQPLKWNREAARAGVRRRVFCASLADVFEDWQGPIVDHEGRQLFHENFGYSPDPELPAQRGCPCTMRDLRFDLFRLIDGTPNLDWQLLTKRPENVRQMWTLPNDCNTDVDGIMRRNVWIGTSVSNQETADKQIPDLVKLRDLTPVLFLSCEPLLDSIDLLRNCTECGAWHGGQCAGWGHHCLLESGAACESYSDLGVNWVIVGGESGPNARACNAEWIWDIAMQCRKRGVPCFVKQLGSYVRCDNANVLAWPSARFIEDGGDGFSSCRVKLSHKKGGDPDEWPEDLQVMEFPEVG